MKLICCQIDRLYGWKSHPNIPFVECLKKQDKGVLVEYEEKIKEIICLFAEKCLNVAVFYKNKDHRKFINIVPVSAKTSDGVAELLMLSVQLCQTLLKSKLQKIQYNVLCWMLK